MAGARRLLPLPICGAVLAACVMPAPPALPPLREVASVGLADGGRAAVVAAPDGTHYVRMPGPRLRLMQVNGLTGAGPVQATGSVTLVNGDVVTLFSTQLPSCPNRQALVIATRVAVSSETIPSCDKTFSLNAARDGRTAILREDRARPGTAVAFAVRDAQLVGPVRDPQPARPAPRPRGAGDNAAAPAAAPTRGVPLDLDGAPAPPRSASPVNLDD